jgi:octaprenyl-diphosphate synthase
MVDGEFLQMRYAANPDIGENEYFAVIARKTARLIRSTCILGGLYGGAEQDELTALGDYGEKVGTAFQVIDDLLDYLGDSEVTGKQVGNDFVEGKMTLPLIIAMERGSEEERQEISALIKGDRQRLAAREKLCRIVTGLDGFILARRRAEELVKEGEDALTVFRNNGDSKELELMIAVGRYILTRTR